MTLFVVCFVTRIWNSSQRDQVPQTTEHQVKLFALDAEDARQQVDKAYADHQAAAEFQFSDYEIIQTEALFGNLSAISWLEDYFKP